MASQSEFVVLSEISTRELRAELLRRENDEIRKTNDKLRQRREALAELAAGLLLLVPDHRRDCSDEKPAEWQDTRGDYCRRCVLLSIIKHGNLDDLVVSLEFTPAPDLRFKE